MSGAFSSTIADYTCLR